jgi:phospholipid-binding lipoprotein MlaA
MKRGPLVFLLLSVTSLTGCASLPEGAQPHPDDRFERFNRGVYRFNDALDRSVAKPVARAYVKVTPRPIRTGVSNFLANLESPITIVNELLQGKIKGFGTDTARLVINTTIGIGGLFDPATRMGLTAGDEDLGQTFGKWGMPAGPFLMLPLFGPSSVRDGVGRVGDSFAHPRNYIEDEWTRYGLTAIDFVDTRAGLLQTDAVLERSFDPYAFIRNAYLQRRQFQVYDGNPPEEAVDEEVFEDEPAPDVAPAAPADTPTAR